MVVVFTTAIKSKPVHSALKDSLDESAHLRPCMDETPTAFLPLGCAQEPAFCQLADIKETTPLYFTCYLYPEAQVCDNILESNAKNCSQILPHQPKALFQKKGKHGGLHELIDYHSAG